MKATLVHISIIEKRVGEPLFMKEEDGAFVTSFKDANDARKQQGLPVITKNFRDWEEDRMKPYLEKHGFKVLSFKDGEVDGSGPVTRIALVRHTDTSKLLEVWYG